jgi:hypothetical protein
MRFRLFAAILLGGLLFGFISTHGADKKKKAAKIEIQLLWGSDLEKSPEKSHKPVEPDVAKVLHSLPLKFKHYFLVNRNLVELGIGETKKVQISEKCEVELKNLDNLKFQSTFFGKGKQTAQRTQELPLYEMLIHGGNAPGSNAWLVVLKRIQ